MGHCISVYLMNKSEFRNDKIDSVIEGKDLSLGDDIHWVELKEGVVATTNILGNMVRVEQLLRLPLIILVDLVNKVLNYLSIIKGFMMDMSRIQSMMF